MHSNTEKKQIGRSILRYPGGKTRAIKLILPHLLRQQAKTLISPFFGGGSIEFAWAKAVPKGEVFGSDIYAPVAHFWQCALNNPIDLAKNVQGHFPLPKADFYSLQKELPNLKGIELATAFYVLNRASFSGATMSGGMSPGHKRFTQTSIDRLKEFKAPNVNVNEADAFDVLESLKSITPDDRVLYLDPPYKIDDSVLYGYKGSTHRGFDHISLARCCNDLSNQGYRIILSYNDDVSIRGLYPGFRVENASWAYGMKNISGSAMGKSSEILLFSGTCD